MVVIRNVGLIEVLMDIDQRTKTPGNLGQVSTLAEVRLLHLGVATLSDFTEELLELLFTADVLVVVLEHLTVLDARCHFFRRQALLLFVVPVVYAFYANAHVKWLVRQVAENLRVVDEVSA